MKLRVIQSVDLNTGVGKYQIAQIGTRLGHVNFIKIHCIKQHNPFQIRTCDVSYCPIRKTEGEKLLWLTDPMLNEDRLASFDDIIATETTEDD